jgi:hypothetical protein
MEAPWTCASAKRFSTICGMERGPIPRPNFVIALRAMGISSHGKARGLPRLKVRLTKARPAVQVGRASGALFDDGVASGTQAQSFGIG